MSNESNVDALPTAVDWGYRAMFVAIYPSIHPTLIRRRCRRSDPLAHMKLHLRDEYTKTNYLDLNICMRITSSTTARIDMAAETTQPATDGTGDATLEEAEALLHNIISSLYLLLVQASTHSGTSTTNAMHAELQSLVSSLRDLSSTAQRLPSKLPLDIIQYVEQARNPDIYTREFVELVMRYNQQMVGRAKGYDEFANVLADEMAGGIPELADVAKGIVQKRS